MPVMDEFKEEREALKHGSPKQKLQYFMDYYKWPTITIILVSIVAISLIHSFVTKKEIAFYSMFLNSVEKGSASHCSEDFAETLGIDTDKYEVLFDASTYIDANSMDQASVASMQKIMIYLAAGDLDVIVTDTNSLQHYTYLGTLVDLRDVLSEEQLEKYEPYLYYADNKIIEEQAAATENFDMNYTVTYPENPFDSSTMADPIPVGICVNTSPVLSENYSFQEGSIIFGIFNSSPREEMAVEFLEYLNVE